jgi:hypothetical protein
MKCTERHFVFANAILKSALRMYAVKQSLVFEHENYANVSHLTSVYMWLRTWKYHTSDSTFSTKLPLFFSDESGARVAGLARQGEGRWRSAGWDSHTLSKVLPSFSNSALRGQDPVAMGKYSPAGHWLPVAPHILRSPKLFRRHL